MPASFKKGDKVQQILPAPFVGVVDDISMTEDELGYLVNAGDGRVRWFKESDLAPAEKQDG